MQRATGVGDPLTHTHTCTHTHTHTHTHSVLNLLLHHTPPLVHLVVFDVVLQLSPSGFLYNHIHTLASMPIHTNTHTHTHTHTHTQTHTHTHTDEEDME